MLFIEPAEIFRGVLVIVAPHMDDEVLACGGTIARLPDKDSIHCIYATDGAKSPAPACSRLKLAARDLSSVRMREAKKALGVLGVREENLQFLGFPDGQLRQHIKPLSYSLTALFEKIRPSCVLVPFRYDRHPDHLALNRAAMHAVKNSTFKFDLFEYFVYYRWSLLPGKDLRAFIRPDQLIKIDIRTKTLAKKQALECFVSQTTLFFPWQDRPIIPAQRVTEVASSPECFVKYDPRFSHDSIFTRARPWIRITHRVEPLLKNKKEQIASFVRFS